VETSTTGTAEWVSAAPAPQLSSMVGRYIGYRLEGFPPCIHRGLPSRYLTFIVSIGDDIDVLEHPDPTQTPGRYRCVLSGLSASPALIAHRGAETGVAIELSPLGCRRLLAMPARTLSNRSYELADVVGALGDELWERLQYASTWPERFAACDDVLTRLAVDAPVAAELAHAWGEIVRSGGLVRMSRLAASTGWTRQHLARRFTDEIGMGPKTLARVVRFERANSMLRSRNGSLAIADVAAACGYYDQAHLNRDFGELAGCSPSTLVREDLPSFQDETEDDPASLRA
jgi:AraC-like DNA-binding protein